MPGNGEAPRPDTYKFPDELTNNYTIKDTIGTGGFAKVKAARHKMTNEKVAIKIMDKEQLRKTNDLARVTLEIAALKKLKHQNISRLYQTLETAEKFYLVLEHASGGELFDYIVARERCKEEEARIFFRQIVSAVAYCHYKGVIHRDLKPENLLLDEKGAIKLIDFGLISMPNNVHTDLLKTCCGSAAYAAPELIRGEAYLGESADVWSLGILLYALLCGFLPFDDEDTQKLYRLIQKGQYEIPVWLSEGSQKIIGQLLKHKPESRLTMDQILSHPWVVKGTDVERIDFHSSIESDTGEGDTTGLLDAAVVIELAKYYSCAVAQMETYLRDWKYDAITASYFLLCARKSRGGAITLPSHKSYFPGLSAPVPATSEDHLVQGTKRISIVTQRPPASLVSDAKPPIKPTSNLAKQDKTVFGSDPNLYKAKRSSGDLSAHKEEKGLLPTLLQNQFKAASIHGLNAGTEGMAGTQRPLDGGAMTMKVEKIGSHETLSTAAKGRGSIPDIRGSNPDVSKMPRGSAGSGIFQTIASSMMSLFSRSTNDISEPRKVKGLFSVSTTSCKEPALVLEELNRVLNLQPVPPELKAKGYVVKAKLLDGDGKNYLSIQFEICQVLGINVTGIVLKRLKGDIWAYKKSTEGILAQMRL